MGSNIIRLSTLSRNRIDSDGNTDSISFKIKSGAIRKIIDMPSYLYLSVKFFSSLKYLAYTTTHFLLIISFHIFRFINKSNKKNLYKFFIALCLLFSPFYSEAIAQSTTTGLQKGDILITEINWAGSTLSSDDEWIEIYNTTTKAIDLSQIVIKGIGNGSTGISPAGIIQPNEYFVISEAIDPGKTVLLLDVSKKQQYIEAKLSLSIPNSKTSSSTIFTITIEDKTTKSVIDEVLLGNETPFAGTNTTGTTPFKASMARIDTLKETRSNVSSSWITSNNRQNILICNSDFATPGAPNFSTTNETIYEIENTCFKTGIKAESSGLKGIKVPATENANEIFAVQHSFGINNGKYEIQVHAFNEQQGQKEILLMLDGDALPQPIEYRILSSNELNQVPVINFAKPKSLDRSTLRFSTSSKSENVFIDKVIIKTKDNNYNNSQNLNFNNAVLKQGERTSVETSEIIDTGRIRYYSAAFKAKATSKNPNLLPQSIIFKLYSRNIFSGHEQVKKVYSPHVLQGVFKEYTLDFSTEIMGAYSFEVEVVDDADVHIESVAIKEVQKKSVFEPDILDIIPDNIKYTYHANKAIFAANTSGKILSSNGSYVCDSNTVCQVMIEMKSLTAAQVDPEQTIAELYIRKDSGEKEQIIKHIKQKDADKVLTVEVFTLEESKISFGLYSYGYTALEINKVIVKQSQNPSKELSVKSRKLTPLNVTVLDKSLPNSLINVYESERKLSEANYQAKFMMKRKTGKTENEIVLKIIAYDHAGKRLFTKDVRDTDISNFGYTNITGDFELTSHSKIMIVVRYVGHQNEVNTEVELNGFELIKI